MPTNNLQALLSADISDPTDFPTNELRQLDSSLRCTICSEFYDAPVTLGCGHCFCSLVRSTDPDATGELTKDYIVHTRTRCQGGRMPELPQTDGRDAL